MTSNIGIITQARYGSSRLRGKVLLKASEESYLETHLKRLKRSKLSSHFILATTMEPEAEEIASIGSNNNFIVYRGSELDVLDRFYQAAKIYHLDVIIRVTSDCPLNDGELIDIIISHYLNSGCSYVSNINPPTFPDGLDIEVLSFAALETAWRLARDHKDREHVTPYVRSRPDIFSAFNVENHVNLSSLRLTLDTIKDHQLLSTVINKLGTDLPWEDYVSYILGNPELIKLNNTLIRNSGY